MLLPLCRRRSEAWKRRPGAVGRGGRCAARESRALTTLQAERTRYRNRIRGSAGAARGEARCGSMRSFRNGSATVTRLGGRAAAARGAGAARGDVARCWTRVEAERQRARRTGTAAGARDAPAGTAAQRLARVRGDRGAERDGARRGALQSWPAQSTRGGRAHGPGLGAVSEWHDRAGTRGWRRAGCRRSAGSRWRSRGPGSGINRPVRSRSGITARFGGGGAVTRRIGIVALARRVIIALWRYVEHGIVPEGALLKA